MQKKEEEPRFTDIRSACEESDCSKCNKAYDPTCFNTEKRNRTPIYFVHM